MVQAVFARPVSELLSQDRSIVRENRFGARRVPRRSRDILYPSLLGQCRRQFASPRFARPRPISVAERQSSEWWMERRWSDDGAMMERSNGARRREGSCSLLCPPARVGQTSPPSPPPLRAPPPDFLGVSPTSVSPVSVKVPQKVRGLEGEHPPQPDLQIDGAPRCGCSQQRCYPLIGFPSADAIAHHGWCGRRRRWPTIQVQVRMSNLSPTQSQVRARASWLPVVRAERAAVYVPCPGVQARPKDRKHTGTSQAQS